MERMPIWQVAVRRLEMPIARFLFIFVGGATFVGLLAALALIFFTGGLGDGALFQGFAGILMIIVFQARITHQIWSKIPKNEKCVMTS